MAISRMIGQGIVGLFLCLFLWPVSSASGEVYWPMFQAALTGAAGGGTGSGGGSTEYDIRVPQDYGTLQDAINAAADGDVILVADGVYTGPGNRGIWFNKAVTIRSEHGAERTIIDCENLDRGFIFYNDGGRGGRLDGFTIKNGRASWLNSTGTWGGGGGGGILVSNASPVIENCIITSCVATSDVAAYGGGIMLSNSEAIIKNCTISYNTIALPSGSDPATNPQGGGGLVIMNSSAPTITNCNISYNTTSGWSTGGGIYVKGSNPLISGCNITHNESNIDYPVDDTLPETEYAVSNSGGISYREFSGGLLENSTISYNKAQERAGIGAFESAPTVRNCIVEYNEATVDGGGGVGLYWNSDARFYDTVIRYNRAEDVNKVNSREQAYGAGVSVWNYTASSSGPSFTRCIIENNTAVGDGSDATGEKGSTGGGINLYGSSATFSQCIIRNNQADNRAGISISGVSRARILDSVVSGNISNEWGGGISLYYGADAVITNCTVVNNVANNTHGHTGWTSSLLSYQSSPVVTNTIFRGNSLPSVVLNGGSPVITYCNVEGGTPGIGNINSDPLFAASDDFHLSGGSPCIDSGNNRAPEIETVDLEGSQRVRNGVVDMGAYEY